MARQEALQFTRFVVIQGGYKQQAAGELGVSPRTLRRWERELLFHPTVELRGRPLRRSSAQDRNRVLTVLELLGPGTGLETLRWLYPGMARGELQDLLRRYRLVYCRKHPVLRHELQWLLPGAVWAMDHAWLPEPIDGTLLYAFAVRDLASGYQLLWEPVEAFSAAETVRAMEDLFALAGPPLVVKSDWGPGFISQPLQELFSHFGIKHLLSPPHWPRYNGSVESGIRWLKQRTEHQARRAGHPGYWSSEDMERARWITNHISHRPRRPAPSVDLWHGRLPLTPLLRQSFSTTVTAELAAARADMGLAPAVLLSPKEETSIQRTAISQALVAHGILKLRRRQVSLPIKSLFAAKIS